jgi:hypothetical protein
MIYLYPNINSSLFATQDSLLQFKQLLKQHAIFLSGCASKMQAT